MASAQSEVTVADGPLSGFELHGYRPSPNLSDDVTYMDLVMIITRSSMLRQGSMGCILVRPHLKETVMADGKETSRPQNEQGGDGAQQILDRVIAAATNTSLFQPDDSDVHAEINAIGQVSKRFHSSSHTRPTSIFSSQGATAYITMPPCKRCFGALYAAGVKRIVSRRQHSPVLLIAASKVGVEMAYLTQDELDRQKARLYQLFSNDKVLSADVSQQISLDEKNAEEIGRRRKQRKEEKQARKMAKIAQTET